LSQGQNKLLATTISDPHNVPEVFVTSVVNAALISGSSIAVTLGMRRMVQETFTPESQEVVYVVSRPVLTLGAAEDLVEMLSGMLARARSQRLQDIAPGTATPQ
jgi:energy-converting hydrogenase Eha subunit A